MKAGWIVLIVIGSLFVLALIIRFYTNGDGRKPLGIGKNPKQKYIDDCNAKRSAMSALAKWAMSCEAEAAEKFGTNCGGHPADMLGRNATTESGTVVGQFKCNNGAWEKV